MTSQKNAHAMPAPCLPAHALTTYKDKPYTHKTEHTLHFTHCGSGKALAAMQKRETKIGRQATIAHRTLQPPHTPHACLPHTILACGHTQASSLDSTPL